MILISMVCHCIFLLKLLKSIKELLFDTYVEDMFNAGYDNEQNIEDIDCYSSDDYKEIENVGFQNKADDNVVIKDFSTPYPFLNKLSSTRAVFRGLRQQQVNVIGDIPEEDPDNDQIDTAFKLWFIKNDLKSVLVFYGRNVKEGRCAGKKDKKDKAMPNTDRFAEALMEKVQYRRTSLTRFLAQSIRSSNAIALDSSYLLVLITETSQSRQHESRKSPTAELFDVDSGRIFIHHCEY
ncbi:hypothetical protein Tco_1345046 [Tanacetum coccineum]